MTSSESSSSVPLARNPIALLRTRSYVMLLVLGALVGIPVAAVAYFLLKFVDVAQQYVFVSLPDDLGWDPAPTWWPILPLMFSGLVVALTIEHLHGTAGHEPAEGFKSTGPVDPVDLPGIVLASLATLCLGAVLGPEAPLIAIGSGLGVLAVHLVKKDAPATALVVIGTAGSFAAVSTLFGSPLAGAFLLMEAAGIGGPLLGVVLTPGLLAAGVGSLIFVGLDNWTGFGTFSLSVGPIPLAGSPTVAETCWAVGIGIIAAVLGTAIKRGALALRPVIARRRVLLTPLVGIAVALLAIGFAAGHRQGVQLRALRRPERARSTAPERCGLVGRGRRAPHGVQGRRVWRSRSAAFAVARCFPACSSARPSGSPSPTFPVCR